MKTGAIIQARMNSSRFPGKVLYPLFQGMGSMEIMVKKLRMIKAIDEIVVATTVNEIDKPIIELCEKIGVKYYRGSEDDVLQRVVDCAVENRIGIIIDLTSDCPLFSIDLLLLMIQLFDNYEYLSNVITRSFPDGYDIQIYKAEILEKLTQRKNYRLQKAHTGWNILHNSMFLNPLKIGNIPAPKKYYYPKLELTLDYKEDAKIISKIFNIAGTIVVELDKVLEMINSGKVKMNNNLYRKLPGEG